MLTSVDRVQLVVEDRRAATQTWRDIFGAEVVTESESRALGAKITTVQAGVSEFEFLEPFGAGPVAEWAGRWRQGLYGAGFATPDIHKMKRHFESQNVPYVDEDGRVLLAAEATHGMPTVISEDAERTPVGHISYLYEVTNPVADWQDTAAEYTRIFALDPSQYSSIRSQLYGYEGTLTLFNPPNRLDRIEVTQTSGDGAMHRFYDRRGPSLYMCYVETTDVAGMAARLRERGARFTQSEDRPAETGLFIHPSALHGMLMGVSLTNYAWTWSGRPDLAGEKADEYRAH